MEGFDRAEAAAFVAERFAPFLDDPAQRTAWAEKLLEADLEYMRVSGVIAENEFDPDAYYDDDDAFAFVADRVSGEDIPETLLMDLLEEYFEAFEAYMEQAHLIAWD